MVALRYRGTCAVAAVRAAGVEDAGLFDLLGPDEGPAA